MAKITLTLPDGLVDELRTLAARDFRTLDGQVTYLLARTVGKKTGSMFAEGQDENEPVRRGRGRPRKSPVTAA